MIETIVLLVVLLSVSLILCWGAKPRKDTEWRGEQAAAAAQDIGEPDERRRRNDAAKERRRR